MRALGEKANGRGAASQEPVAFWGGVFAGALGLNVDEDPLRGWLQRTAADAQVLECCLIALKIREQRGPRIAARLQRSTTSCAVLRWPAKQD